MSAWYDKRITQLERETARDRVLIENLEADRNQAIADLVAEQGRTISLGSEIAALIADLDGVARVAKEEVDRAREERDKLRATVDRAEALRLIAVETAEEWNATSDHWREKYEGQIELTQVQMAEVDTWKGRYTEEAQGARTWKHEHEVGQVSLGRNRAAWLQAAKDCCDARKWARHFLEKYKAVTVICQNCEFIDTKSLLDGITRLQVSVQVWKTRAEHWRRKADHWQVKFQEIEDDLASVCEGCHTAEEFERFRKRLELDRLYMEHKLTCELRVKSPPSRCTCGLNEAAVSLAGL